MHKIWAYRLYSK